SWPLFVFARRMANCRSVFLTSGRPTRLWYTEEESSQYVDALAEKKGKTVLTIRRMGGKDLEDGKASNKSEENSYHLQPKHSGVNPVPEIMKSHKDHICHPLRLGRAACLALLGGLSVVSCTTVPQHEFQTYRRTFDEARVQSEHVLADYAAARQLKSNLVVQGNLKANT